MDFNMNKIEMHLILLISIFHLVQPQAMIDQDILTDIFGTPTPQTNPATEVNERYPEISPVPDITQDIATIDQSNYEKEGCKCVPYYLCDASRNGAYVNNASVTGWGTIDIRFGENECQESIELCCKSPKSPESVPEPTEPPRLQGCGHRNPNGLDFTITGGMGDEAQFGEFPWVIAILDPVGTYEGVGVLIHPEVVMTGAHVVYNFTIDGLKVRAGEWDTQTIKERLPYQERTIREMIIHPEFHNRSLRNDIALLRLDSPLRLTDHINVICMPDQGENFDSSTGCVANGWGKDVFGQQGRYAAILKKVDLNMVPHGRCNNQLQNSRLGSRFQLHSSFVCAGGEEGKDTCQGDGGAPLACPVYDNRYKLTGLVAWGIGCGQKDLPAVYASVAAFRDWVDYQMGVWGLETSGYIY